MNRPNWTHFIYLIAIVGFSLLSWIIKRLQEQAQIKKARDAAEHRELETLRTGRDPGPAQQPHDAGAQADADARREAQLRELRRRAAMRSAPGAPPPVRTAAVFVPPRAGPPARPPIVLIPGSPGPIVPQRGRGAPPTRPTPRAGPASMAPLPVPKPGRARGQGRKPDARPPARQAPARRDDDAVPSLGTDLSSAAPEGAPAESVRSARAAGPSLSPADLRRAIVLREILDPPISERREPGVGGLPM